MKFNFFVITMVALLLCGCNPSGEAQTANKNTMKLLHNSYTTSLSLEEAVKAVMNDRSVEIDIAVSNRDWLAGDDWEEARNSYDLYFEDTFNSLTKNLGKPLFRGEWNDPDLKKWEYVVPEHIQPAKLAVWEKDSVKLYLSYWNDDRDLPIVIALGTEGCEQSGIAYPGQWE